MKSSIAAFVSGLGIAVLGGYLLSGRSLRRTVSSTIDLNQCSANDLQSLGLDGDTSERIIENRPYRSKLELVSRIMLPNDAFALIKERISITNPNEPVKVAS